MPCQCLGHGALVKIAKPYLVEGVGLDLGELVFHVVGVHGANLIASGSSQDLDDLNQLVDTRLTGEQRLAKHELSHDAASGPDI